MFEWSKNSSPYTPHKRVDVDGHTFIQFSSPKVFLWNPDEIYRYKNDKGNEKIIIIYMFQKFTNLYIS